ncbi:hypothetical protein CCR80_09710 [Rhodothalassium salexigens]|uniref:SHOCT-like domain-containing protein n=1 Tax=Rhodothalassium salexigens TaxID=1086 RepID=UPI001912413F|nr:hypothetical protein [Rhodothalassium salexigens]MBK5921303.1 hypothetical protein [Rhodothalassium salexigens]
MSERRKKILDLLAQGRISSAEAERLLAALAGDAEPRTPAEPASETPRYLCIESQHDTEGRVDIKVPLVLVKAGVNLANLMPENSIFDGYLKKKGGAVDFKAFGFKSAAELIEAVRHDPIEMDLQDERVKIYCC